MNHAFLEYIQVTTNNKIKVKFYNLQVQPPPPYTIFFNYSQFYIFNGVVIYFLHTLQTYCVKNSTFEISI